MNDGEPISKIAFLRISTPKAYRRGRLRSEHIRVIRVIRLIRGLLLPRIRRITRMTRMCLSFDPEFRKKAGGNVFFAIASGKWKLLLSLL